MSQDKEFTVINALSYIDNDATGLGTASMLTTDILATAAKALQPTAEFLADKTKSSRPLGTVEARDVDGNKSVVVGECTLNIPDKVGKFFGQANSITCSDIAVPENSVTIPAVKPSTTVQR